MASPSNLRRELLATSDSAVHFLPTTSSDEDGSQLPRARVAAGAMDWRPPGGNTALRGGHASSFLSPPVSPHSSLLADGQLISRRCV